MSKRKNDRTKNTTKGKKIMNIKKLKINTICDTIRARIMNKSAIQEWSNGRDTGKMFTIDICDESKTIKCHFFGEAADKYHELIELNKIYTIAGGLVQKVDGQRPSINGKEIMIPIEANINLQEEKEDEKIPKIKFELKKIKEILNLPDDSSADIIAVITTKNEVEFIYIKKTGKLFKKREITLADDSDYEVKLTIWNEEAENFEGSEGDIIVLKGVKINTYKNIKNIKMTKTTITILNPDLPEGNKLKSWYNKTNKNKKFKKLEKNDSGNEDDPLEGSSQMNCTN